MKGGLDKMFKLIKLLFKIVGILLLIITLIPIILLAIMYKGYTPPVEDFEAGSSLSFNDIAAYKLDEFLADEEAEEFSFTFTKTEANVALKDLYAANNPNFGSTDENIPEAERKYAVPFGENGGFKGVTLGFYEGGMTIEAGVEAGFSGIYYQTTVFIDLGVDIEPVEISGVLQTQYKLVVKNIAFGNLPILWMYDLANWGFGLFGETDLNGFIAEVVSGFGNYDLATKSVWLNTMDIIDLIAEEGDDSRVMLEALLGFLDEEELLSSGFGDGTGGLSFALGKMRSTETQYTLNSTISSDEELEQMFTGQLTSLLISSLGGGDTLKYDMHEHAFNQLLDYYVGDSMNVSQEIELGSSVYELSTQPLFARFVGSQVHFTIIMKLNKQGDAVNTFQTHFTLKAIPSVSADGQDLVFTVDSIDIGDEVSVSNERVSAVLSLIGENEIISGNQIILEGFLGEFASQGVEVQDVSVHGQYIRFELLPVGGNAQILADLQAAIGDALADVLSDPQYADVEDAFNEFLNDPEADPQAVIDAINQLPPEDQEALFEALFDALDDVDDLEDLLP